MNSVVVKQKVGRSSALKELFNSGEVTILDDESLENLPNDLIDVLKKLKASEAKIEMPFNMESKGNSNSFNKKRLEINGSMREVDNKAIGKRNNNDHLSKERE